MDKMVKTNLESHFREIRNGVIGNNEYFMSPYGTQKILYADWIATGRLYRPIEEKITGNLGPYLANTHSYSSETGKVTSEVYMEARERIKGHVNADEDDVLVTTGSGMTGALDRLLQIMGLKGKRPSNPNEVPVVFITHMEHHSNQVSWLEAMADVVIVPPGENMMPSLDKLDELLWNYKDRTLKIGAFTACSNVTGEMTNHKGLAKTMHAHGGICFFDFAASAPYVDIDMHPSDPDCRMDAIYFSPHKFLGGPGACGVLIFNKWLYKNKVPAIPGGGNVKWTTPWGTHSFFENIEIREDGGTPGIIQTIKAALAIQLKEKMDTKLISIKELALLGLFRDELKDIGDIQYYGNSYARRIGCLSFNLMDIHYNLVVRLLNDRFGIQVRGGWSCASTFAHYLFGMDRTRSSEIMNGIDQKNLKNKPGWVRVSLHPTMNSADVEFITEALREIVNGHEEWAKDYKYNPLNNEYEYIHRNIVDMGRYHFFGL
ncbi:aminotransferase class V-fold PLP-dependent enzyme [Muricauda oceani]|uniref:Aminotransferase class V-fold PLP-dependent enzyme n=1 Tax=Flagellimonas oceani TaxID=2698672 RepID=A0A6G7IZF1_9FLAO|nr:aminotransferase class V-fold PLP-dependent enzyme [Allomuricauda oceani]MBW8243650.1 aminotransferase class V-fold PLP-dependent enzyme [Allomuricauda oceani]QII43983.1 aminotransferase class V-fold PLP-dependent enzyme [Allomuricauda oceani]